MRFGTDGVRGVANSQLTPEYALALGRAAARILGGPRMLVGRDPRRSGPLLEAAFAAGVCAEGVDVELLGVLPTPAVAYRSQSDSVPAAMISASHNSFEDNGIKLFAAGGTKLSDETQQRLEAEIESIMSSGSPSTAPVGAAVGEVTAVDDGDGAYVDHLVGGLDGGRLDGLSVVLDCANGAASAIAGALFERLGANVEVLSAEPDGLNINASCGSTYPQRLQDAVRAAGADGGFAFDGDADRMLAVDANGVLVDGDQLIAIAAIDLHERGRLVGDTVVVTVMSNLGFRLAMAAAGISVVDTAVGDRYVLEALDTGGFVLGGEQSGHIIFRDRATTGDGLLSALVVADVMVRSGRALSDLAASAMTRLPQVLRNVRIAAPMPDVALRLAAEIAAAEVELGEQGRVLVRASGTEPVVRVMVEAVDVAAAEAIVERLSGAVSALG